MRGEASEKQLIGISKRISNLGMISFCVLFLAVLLAGWGYLVATRIQFEVTEENRVLPFLAIQLAAVSGISSVFCMGLLVWRERLISIGEVIFEILADEYEEGSGQREMYSSRYRDDAKFAFRSFPKSKNLPLMPSNLGPVLYLSVAISALLLSSYVVIGFLPYLSSLSTFSSGGGF